MFQATKDGLIDATTRVWPVGVEVWPSVVVLSMNVIIMVFALCISYYPGFANHSHGGGLLFEIHYGQTVGELVHGAFVLDDIMHHRDIYHERGTS